MISWQKLCTRSPIRASEGAIPIRTRMCVSFVMACAQPPRSSLSLLRSLQWCVIRMMTWYSPLLAPRTLHTSLPETWTSYRSRPTKALPFSHPRPSWGSYGNVGDCTHEQALVGRIKDIVRLFLLVCAGGRLIKRYIQHSISFQNLGQL